MSRITLAVYLCLAPLFGGCAAEPPAAEPPARVATGESRSELKATARGEDWPSFLGLRGDGTSEETGIEPGLWAPHPPVVWTVDLGVSYGGPAISEGRLFQFDRFGSEERVRCLDAESGRLIWQWGAPVDYEDMYGYNNGPRCAPIVDGNRVFTYGVAGRLSCLNATNGQLEWTKDLVEEYGVTQNFFGVASSPFVYEDLLLVMVGGSPAGERPPAHRLDLAKPSGSAIVAFDKTSGAEVYRIGDDLASYSSVTVRNLAGKPTGLAFLRSGLLAWSPRTGKPLFEFPWRASILESVNAAMPVTAGNRVWISETYEIGSVLLEVNEQFDPQVIWQDSGSRRDQAFRAHWSTPVLVDGYLYGCSGRNQPDSDFRCVDFDTGKVQWFDRRHERSSLLSIDGYLIVLGEYGRLELIRPNPTQLDVVEEADLHAQVDPRDERPLLEYPCWAAPVVSHGLLYVRGKDKLVCMQLISGEG